MRILFFLLSLCFLSNSSLAGDAHGNGGDAIRILFEEGRAFSTHILNRIPTNKLLSQGEKHLSKKELEWLIKNRNLLREDIKKSQHQWRKTHPKEVCNLSTCACTNLNFGDPISLVFEVCTERIKTKHAAAKLLVHESVHHLLGADESIADRIAATVFAVWTSLGHPESPHWFALPPKIHESDKHSGAVWIGTKLYILNNDNIIDIYEPRSNTWKTLKAENSFREWLEKPYPVWLEHAVAAGGKAVLVGAESAIEPELGSGIMYNPATNRWELMSNKNAMPFRESYRVIPAENKLIVWGGEYGWNQLRPASGGAIFDPQTNSWSPLLPEPLLYNRVHSVTVYAEGKFLVWGGARLHIPGVYAEENPRDGAVYDFAKNKWDKMTLENVPAGRAWAHAVWTGKEVAIFGGGQSPIEGNAPYLHSGGLYDLKENKWRTMNMKDAPEEFEGPSSPPHVNLSPAWTGGNLILKSKTLGFFNPLENRWINFENILHPEIFPYSSSLNETWTWTGLEVLYWRPGMNRGYALYP